MARLIRHASELKPISVPVFADVSPANWDNVQSFSYSSTQPKEDIYQLGQLTKIATAKETLEATLSMTQLEHGAMKEFLQLAGFDNEPAKGISLKDFSSTSTDFISPGKESFEGDIEQTLWLQKMVLNSFSLEINAEERIERSYEFSGSRMKIARYANKCIIFKSVVAESGVDGEYVITLDDPAPVVCPNVANQYILQLYRIRDGVATEMTSVDYSFSAPSTLTIADADEGDVYRIWYSAGTNGTSEAVFAVRDSQLEAYLKADNVVVEISDGTNAPVVLNKLTSLSLSSTLNRIDEGVIGSDEKILREVENYEVTLGLTSYVKASEIEEVFMNQAGQNWGIIDFSMFGAVDVSVKIYDDANKSDFLIGYKMIGLEFSDTSSSFNANEFGDVSLNLSTDNLLISSDIANM